MNATGRRGLVVVLALVAALAGAVPASGAVRVGAPMNAPVDTPGAEGCEALVLPPLRPTTGVPPSCTLMSAAMPGGATSQTPRGQWVIVRARVRTGPRTGPMVFSVVRVLRSQAGGVTNPSGAICCTVPVESQVFTPAPNTVTTIPVRLPVKNTVDLVEGEPIEVVDYLGISPLTLQSTLPLHTASGGAGTMSFGPAIRAGGQALAGPTLAGFAVIDGDYEPDANGDGFGDESCPVAGGRAASRQAGGCPPGGGGGGAGAGGGAGGGGSTVGGAADPRPASRARLSAPRQTTAQVRRTGKVRVKCTTTPAGRCRARATVSRTTARRLGLRVRGKSKTVNVGKGTVRTTRAGRARTLSVRLSTTARRAIGRSRRTVAIRVEVTASASGHRDRKVVRTVKVRRR
ncbi:MAG: hypothetical protein ITG02_16040 [Patulibacter sp.]|nr:hypothetical protein [Patulibacter sp.]